jgi:hypothetical protein
MPDPDPASIVPPVAASGHFDVGLDSVRRIRQHCEQRHDGCQIKVWHDERITMNRVPPPQFCRGSFWQPWWGKRKVEENGPCQKPACEQIMLNDEALLDHNEPGL